MARTLNGEVLIDDTGNFNEQLWLENLIACAELLKKNKENKEDDGDKEDGDWF